MKEMTFEEAMTELEKTVMPKDWTSLHPNSAKIGKTKIDKIKIDNFFFIKPPFNHFFVGQYCYMEYSN